MRFLANRTRWAGPACLLLSIAASPIVSAQTRPLRLVSTAWAPFTNPTGQPRFALDLVEAALGRIGVSSTTAIVDAAQFTTSLLTGDLDGSAAAWKDAERERVLLFSQPYLENRLVLVGRKGADVSATSLSALAGRRIAIVEGYSYGAIVDLSGPTFVRSRSEEDSVARLLGASVDYVLMDELVVQYLVDNYDKEAQTKLELGSKPLVTRQLYLAVNRSRPDAQSIIDRFNAELRGMIADHTYHRLLHVEWIRTDVDGDGLLEYVPQSDLAGPTEPRRAYSLLSTSELSTSEPTPSSSASKSRFYVGGNIYSDWATVPDKYKLSGASTPNPARSTGTIFRFSF